MKITHAWVSPAQALGWITAVKAALAKAGFTVRKPAMQAGWADSMGYDTWAAYEQATPEVLAARAPDTIPLEGRLMNLWVVHTHEAMQAANKTPCTLQAFKRAWAAALRVRSWPKLDEAMERFNTLTKRQALTPKEEREVRRYLKALARREELTQSAIDWAVNAEELWEQSGEDAEALADLAIGATLDSLGKKADDEDSFDRADVVRAIEVAFLEGGREAELDAVVDALNRAQG